MKTYVLLKSRIRELADESNSASEFLMKLYCEVIPDKWEDIERFNDWPKCNVNTSLFIMEEMHKKWDPVMSNMLWMNKEFSTLDQKLNDFQVSIPDNCYTLRKEPIATKEMVEGFAQQEVEEIKEEHYFNWEDYNV